MKKKKTKKTKSERDYIEEEERLDSAFDAILELLESFCEKYLNEEYWELCHDMVTEIYDMGAPFDKGKPESWASGIVHALGMVNCLQDPSFAPYMESSKIAQAFGVSQSTMQNKSKLIRDNLETGPLDPEWCVESLLADNPLAWMFNVDGVAMDIRNAPREVQEQAYQDGMIPFIPDDYPRKTEEQSESGNNIRIIEFPSGKRNKTEPGPFAQDKGNGPALFDRLKD